MTAILVNSSVDDEERRRVVFDGDIVVLAPGAATLALCDHARTFLDDAFAPYDPRTAQDEMEVEEFVARFAGVKPAFIHDPITQRLIREVLAGSGCDLDATYQDVPRLRGVTAGGYLTAGVGYAHPAHRDTWFSAPVCQLNWWLSIYEMSGDDSMAFHPQYWSRPVKNSSSEFDYYEWNANGRAAAATQIHTDTRKQPLAQEVVEMSPDLRVVCPVGGTIVFSAAQLHSTVPNTTAKTRFSIDFRTVNLNDLIDGRGAHNIDSKPSGTSLNDFRQAKDGAPMPEAILAMYGFAPPEDAQVVFVPA